MKKSIGILLLLICSITLSFTQEKTNYEKYREQKEGVITEINSPFIQEKLNPPFGLTFGMTLENSKLKLNSGSALTIYTSGLCFSHLVRSAFNK